MATKLTVDRTQGVVSANKYIRAHERIKSLAYFAIGAFLSVLFGLCVYIYIK